MSTTNTAKLGIAIPVSGTGEPFQVAQYNAAVNTLDGAVGFTICTSSTRPATPWAGQPIFETDTALSLVWDGDSWEAAGGGGGGVTISATAPAAPAVGDLWWDSVNGELYVYYDDGTSSQWVAAAGPSVTVAAVAPTGYEGQLWLDDTDGSMYVYYTDPGGGSSSWIGAVSRSGGILQVVSTTKTDSYTSTATSFTTVTGLTASITPRSTSSKIMVMAQIASSGAANTVSPHFKVTRGGTDVFVGDAAGSRTRAVYGGFQTADTYGTLFSNPITFLDSPASTSSLTYQVEARIGSSGTVAVNRSIQDTDNADRVRGASSITLIEVAG
jgi:hypothetical protein